MYDSKSPHAEEFICDEEILATLEFAKKNKNNKELLQEILQQAEEMKGLSYRQVALLLECDDSRLLTRSTASL